MYVEYVAWMSSIVLAVVGGLCAFSMALIFAASELWEDLLASLAGVAVLVLCGAWFLWLVIG